MIARTDRLGTRQLPKGEVRNMNQATPPRIGRKAGIDRRALLGSTLSLPFLASCTTSSAPGRDGFQFRDGIGRRAGGPGRHALSDAAGAYPRATPRDWWQPRHAVDSFSRLDEIFESSTARRASGPSAWQRAAREPDIRFSNPPSLGGGRYDVDDYLDRQPVTGLLIAKGATILVERYQYDRTDAMRLTSFSMAKTIVAMLIGLAVEDRLVASLEDPAQRYATGLAGTEYGSTPLQALLTMSSGIRFREEYDGADDAARLSRATFGRQTPGGADAVRAFNERVAQPGKRWYYASSETYVLAMVARAVFRRSLSAVLQERIWQPMGAEADGTWLTDRSGLEIGYMGFNATLRDYARLGSLLANGGEAGGRQLVPNSWIKSMSTAAFSSAETGRPFGYGYQTWTLPGRSPTFGLFGVRGQYTLVDPVNRLIMVNTAVRANPRDPGNAATFALWGAVQSTLGT
jgi:CubicO group peptidase (beta-lactamase class C family)